ncbi:MAG: chorismate mutase [Clostridia bacterium]
MRGIRGAATVDDNSRESILTTTRELLHEMQSRNAIQSEDLAAVLFSLTDDLDAAFPAEAARQLGWVNVPLMCFQEVRVPGALERVVRVLMLWNSDVPQPAVHHVYQGAAAVLRADLTGHQQSPWG